MDSRQYWGVSMLYEFTRANGKTAFEHFDFDIEAQGQAERSNKILHGDYQFVSVSRLDYDPKTDKDKLEQIWQR